MSKKIKYIFFLLLFICAVCPYFYLKKIENSKVTHLKLREYKRDMEVIGIIEGSESTPITLSYPVYIKDSMVKENSYVNKGQLLFTIDTEMMKSAIKDIGFTQYTQAGMFQNTSELIDATTEICATESGIVKQLAAEEGSLILADENLCVIESDNDLILKISIDQTDYSKINVGDIIRFNPDIVTAREYSAVITDKTAVVRKETSLVGSKTVVDIFAKIINPDEYILSGLDVTGTITNNIKKIYTLPYEYIGQDDMGQFVYIYSNGKAEKIYIETGIEMEEEVEILTVFEADTLFLYNNKNLNGTLLLNYDDK